MVWERDVFYYKLFPQRQEFDFIKPFSFRYARVVVIFVAIYSPFRVAFLNRSIVDKTLTLEWTNLVIQFHQHKCFFPLKRLSLNSFWDTLYNVFLPIIYFDAQHRRHFFLFEYFHHINQSLIFTISLISQTDILRLQVLFLLVSSFWFTPDSHEDY